MSSHGTQQNGKAILIANIPHKMSGYIGAPIQVNRSRWARVRASALTAADAKIAEAWRVNSSFLLGKERPDIQLDERFAFDILRLRL